MPHAATVNGTRYSFVSLRTLLARATPLRSGDMLAGLAAESASERVAAARRVRGIRARAGARPPAGRLRRRARQGLRAGEGEGAGEGGGGSARSCA